VGFIAVVSLPHAVHNSRTFGDPFYSVNIHFSYFRNYEFVVKKGLGCAGCPTREEFSSDAYAGPPVTAFHYVFGMHSAGEIVHDLYVGYKAMYLTMTESFKVLSGTRSQSGYALFLLGVGLLIFGPHRAILAVLLLLANLFPFMMMREADIRLSVYTMPFMCFIMAYGAAGGLQGLRMGAHRLAVGFAETKLRSEAQRFKVAGDAEG
jgi:hypothetical protein